MDDVAVDAKRILLRYGAPIEVLDEVGEVERIELARFMARTPLPERERRLRQELADRGYMEPPPVKTRKSRAKAAQPQPSATKGVATRGAGATERKTSSNNGRRGLKVTAQQASPPKAAVRLKKKAKPKAKSEARPKTKTKTKPKPETKAKAKTKTKAKTKPKTKAKTKAKPKTTAKARPKIKAKPKGTTKGAKKRPGKGKVAAKPRARRGR